MRPRDKDLFEPCELAVQNRTKQQRVKTCETGAHRAPQMLKYLLHECIKQVNRRLAQQTHATVVSVPLTLVQAAALIMRQTPRMR